MKTKKVLLVDFYDSCVGCPCRQYSEETDVAKCEVLYQVIPEGINVLENCPLKDLPERMSCEGESAEFVQGWNAAIDQIELG